MAGAGLARTCGVGPAGGSADLSGALDEDTGLVGGASEDTTELSSSEARQSTDEWLPDGLSSSGDARCSALLDLDNLQDGPCCCAFRPVSTDRARLCAGATGLD